jgi:hypothetical protein
MDKPLALQDVQVRSISRQSAYTDVKVFSPTQWQPLPARRCSWYSRVDPRAIPIDHIRNRTRDLPTFRAIPQPTVPPRTQNHNTAVHYPDPSFVLDHTTTNFFFYLMQRILFVHTTAVRSLGQTVVLDHTIAPVLSHVFSATVCTNNHARESCPVSDLYSINYSTP